MKSNLTCREAQLLIQPYIDKELDDRSCADLLRHIRTCPDCYEELETNFIIFYALKYLDNDKNSSSNMRRIFQNHIRRNEQQLRRRSITRIFYYLLLFVTELLLLLTAASRFLPGFLPFL